MANSIVSTDDVSTNVDDEELEIFGLIWLDDNTQSEDNRDTEQRLRSIINRLKKFQDVLQCEKYVMKRSSKDRLVIIVSGRLGRIIVPTIHEVRQVVSIYVYCMYKKANEEWTHHFPKVHAVITELDELVSRITADHKIQKVVEEPLSINIFNGQSIAGINGKFVFSQVLIDCLLRLESDEKDKTELIKRCKKTYDGNNIELRNIREFKKKYSSDKALQWYSRESFFYKTLNAVLRNEDIHMMFLFREFIADIQHQLKSFRTDKIQRLYRGQRISKEELVTLEQNCGQLISVNSFFSTSADEKQARAFLHASHAANNLEKVLFEINADPKMTATKPYADISGNSEYPGESEILFMIGSIFRLNSVDQNSDDNIWIIRMTLCSENESDLKNVLQYMKQQLGTGETNLRTLGKVLWEMGRLDLAEQYFIRLLNNLPENHHLLSDLYEDLGKIASLTGDYDKSIDYHQKSLALKDSNKSMNTMHADESNNQNSKFV
ncbi:unnamed protein product [Rotaria sordida]|uniref:ADP ribosyltransferase domain-containing protein n=2 Tax=Rotaria sordida TaxID=392033 RepID=A0A819BZB1_9BILA|nr:unnamed protein product [Rotaria sordida]